MSTFRKSQVRSKNIADLAIMPDHLSGYAINKVLDSKYVGVARIVERTYESTEDIFESGNEDVSGYESGEFNFESGIEIQAGDLEKDITDFVFEGAYLAHATISNQNNGVLLSGQSYLLEVYDKCLKKTRGKVNWLGIAKGPEPFTCSGNYVRGSTTTYSVLRKSFKIYFNNDLLAWDDGNGNILGSIFTEDGENFIDYDTGNFSCKLSSTYPSVNIYYKQKSFENYKVWLRNSATRLPVNNGQNKEVFGELFVEEFIPISMSPTPQRGSVQAWADTEPINPNDPEVDWKPRNMYVTVSDNYLHWGDFVGCVIVAYDGSNDYSDDMIGYVTGYDQANKRFSLKYPSEISHTGICKFVKFRLKLWTYGTNWNEIEYPAPSNQNIDILFVESSSLLYEDANNLYNYNDFFKVVDSTVQTLEQKLEEKMSYEKMTDAGGPTGTSSPPISGKVFSEAPMVFSGDVEVPFVEFQVNNQYFKSGSLEIYIDGVRIFHYQSGDNLEDRRILEMDNATGIFRIINITVVDFETEQVYANYVG